MNTRFILLLAIIFLPVIASENISLQVNAQAHDRLPIIIALPLGSDSQLKELCTHIKRAFEFTGQCTLLIESLPAIKSKQELQALWHKGFAYAFFMDRESAHTLSWRMYDTGSAHMIKGKRQSITAYSDRGIAYALADAWWHELTGSPGFFSNKLAYCKEIPAGRNRSYKHICIADFDGSHEQLLVETPTINMAPRWNGDPSRPLLFYSESTNENVRMLASTMDKKRIMASNYDGLNMLPTFSGDGNCVVYCASRGKGTCQLYRWKKKELKKITNNEGNNICPCLTPDGNTVFFSSDFQSNLPTLYSLHIQSGQLERITTEGYCVSPSYCATTGMLAYSKMVNGIMQLFEYDLKTKQHRQLTFDDANKEECSWAADGLHLLCPVDSGKRNRIAYFNTLDKKYTYLTPAAQRCSYPAISGYYQQYPVVQG